MTFAATYDDDVCRVTLAATSAPVGTMTVLFERSDAGIVWTTVRGGEAVTVTGSAASLDDYEFTGAALNHYKATYQSTAPGWVETSESTTITPAMTTAWLKSVTRPFLNVPITIIDYTDVVRAARTAVYDIIGRSFPVAISDVRSSQTFTVTLRTADASGLAAIDALCASGDPLYLHLPYGAPLPGGHVAVGDMTVKRGPSRTSTVRYIDLPCQIVAGPANSVVGTLVTWTSIGAEFATWDALAVACATWSDVAELLGSLEEVIVP